MLEKTKEKYDKGMVLYLKGELSLVQISKKLTIHRGKFTDYMKQNGIVIVNKQNEARKLSLKIY